MVLDILGSSGLTDVLDQPAGDGVQVSSETLHDQEGEGRQPVDHVVHISAGERLPELFPVPGLGEGHDDVGDGGSDVGAHDHGDGGLYRGPRRHQAHNDGGRGGG